MVADMVADMEVDMVADLEVDGEVMARWWWRDGDGEMVMASWLPDFEAYE